MNEQTCVEDASRRSFDDVDAMMFDRCYRRLNSLRKGGQTK